MKPHPRIRKTVKWGGAVVCVLLVAAWVGSMWWSVGWREAGWLAVCSDGSVSAIEGRARARVFPSGLEYARIQRPAVIGWWPEWTASTRGWFVLIPLWIPLLSTLLITAAAWQLDTLARWRAATGMCVKCRYDRAGLAAGAVCPECGAAAPSSLPTT